MGAGKRENYKEGTDAVGEGPGDRCPNRKAWHHLMAPSGFLSQLAPQTSHDQSGGHPGHRKQLTF